MTKIAQYNENLTINGVLSIKDGSQSNGYVLTSDSGGTASWRASNSSSGGTSVTGGTLSSGGTLTLTNSSGGTINVTGFTTGIYTFKTTITSAQVLLLNTTPIVAVQAPGVGFAIEALSAFGRIATYGGSPYSDSIIDITSNNPSGYSQLRNYASSAGITINLLRSTATRMVRFANLAVAGDTATGQLIENTALNIWAPSGDPTGGNSDIIIYGTYRIVPL